MPGTVICIGCGRSQQDYCLEANKQGFDVISVGIGECLVESRFHIPESTHSPMRVLDSVQVMVNKEGCNLQGVIGNTTGSSNLTKHAIAKRFGLRSCGSLVGQASSDKLALFKLVGGIGVRVVETRRASQIEWDDVTKNGAKSCIIKPGRPIAGKKNVFIVQPNESIIAKIKEASQNSEDMSVVLQPYIEGRDVGVMVVAIDGTIIWWIFYEEINCWVDSKVQPSDSRLMSDRDLPKTARDKILDATRLVVSRSTSSGFLLFSFRIGQSGEPLMYEINPGYTLDQGLKSQVERLYCGYSFIENEIKLMTEKVFDLPKL